MGENVTTAPVATKPQTVNRVAALAKKFDREQARELAQQLTMNAYLNLVYDEPRVSRTAYQRIYDMIVEAGTEKYTKYRKTITRYKFFDDPEVPIFGLEDTLYDLVQVFRGAAGGYGTERRLILLRGPVGSSKSTICSLLKKGLERYTQSKAGAIYTYSWKNLDKVEGLYNQPTAACPMHDDPLKLLPDDVRKEVVEELNSVLTERYNKAVREAKAAGKDPKSIPVPHRVVVPGHLNPRCQYFWDRLMAHHDYDWQKVVDEHIVVHRFAFSEDKRIGIGTFQPKDEKNQDSTELTGDINYRKIAQYGSDSDPRAFNFDGELNIANRGVCEFIEILKLDVAFLYDLLGATQEHTIKPKKFAQTFIDEVIIGHTNEPEYKRLQSNEMMEAFRDRTIKIDVPYNIRLDDEIRIYQKDFGPQRVKNIHIAPHTLEVAAMWAILTRLEEPKKAGLTLMQKMKLYNGKAIPGFTEDSVKELKEEAPREGMGGISPRYIQDKVSNTLVSRQAVEERAINPFMVLNELEGGLSHHSLISDEEMKKRFRELLAVVKEEYEDIIKGEVQRAISADEDAIRRLCGNYIENVRAYTQKEKVQNKYTGKYEEPDERLMRAIEEKIDIPESRKDDFRQEIMNYIGALALDGKRFEYNTNARLYKALELKLFEDSRDTIKLKNLVSSVVDDETQQKIDIVKQRLIKQFGYNETSAADVLNYVASIFARGDKKSK